MLPEAKADPARLGKPMVCVAVATCVALQLGAPPFGTGRRPCGVDRAGVPIAAVDEHRHPPRGERDIGTPPDAVKRKLEIDAIAKPATVQLLPKRHFWRSVGAPLAHHAGTRRRR